MSSRPNAVSVFEKAITEHLEVVRQVQDQQGVLKAIALTMTATLRAGKILWSGNGGSASDSQHLAAEIVGRFRRERPGLPSVAPTPETSMRWPTIMATKRCFHAKWKRWECGATC